MKKLFLLLALCGMVAVGCTEGGVDDNINNGGNNTEQPGEDDDDEPEEKPDDGSEIPDDAYITLNKEVLTFVPDGESVEVKVYSNYEWTLTNNCDWVTASISGGEASEEGTSITLTANLTYDNREGTITFSCGKAKKLLVVSQSFKEAIIADENNVFNVPAEGGNVIINYQTTVECEVIIPEEAKSWISLAPATRGLESESATLNIADNNTGAERSVVVKVVAANNSELVAEYTITQAQRYYIEYTSTDGYTITPYSSDAFGATIIRNEYIDGKGYIEFDAPITSIGDEAFWECTSLTSITIPDSVTSIGYFAFCFCTSLTSVTIPESVTEIGSGAFCGCSGLKSFKGKYASSDGRCLIKDGELISFAPCGLTQYTIPDSVTSIGEIAFHSCDSLTSVTIGNGVTSIGDYVFVGCYSLTSVTIPDSVKSIGNEAFEYCFSLTSVTIGNGVTSIGYQAFSGCDSLTSVTIGNGVTSIGDYVFVGCNSLTSVTIPDSVTEIGSGAFFGCNSLTSITIPDSVTSIGNSAFSCCSGLKSFKGKYASSDGRCLIKDGELIGFAPCGLTQYTIPDSVTSIGGRAFYECYSLKSVTIGHGVTSIGKRAFEDCTSLTSITIPDSVTEIGNYAFSRCTSLKEVYCKPTTPPTGDYDMFYNNASLRTIYVPRNSVSAYKFASGWGFYAPYIVEYDF